MDYGSYDEWLNRAIEALAALRNLSLTGPSLFIRLHSMVFNFNVIFRDKSDEYSIILLQDLSRKHNIILYRCFSRPDVLYIVSQIRDLYIKTKDVQMKRTIDIVMRTADGDKILKLSLILEEFMKNNNYAYGMSIADVDFILSTYRNKTELTRIFNEMDVADHSIEHHKTVLARLYYKVLDDFPKLSKIYSKSIGKEDPNATAKTLADLPQELRNEIFSYLYLENISYK